MAARVHPDLVDPRWVPARYDASTDRVAFVKIELDAVAQASFLDRRMPAQWDDMIEVGAAEIPSPEVPPPSLLFHTAFCGSTLLARALDHAPTLVALKEPAVLVTLALAWLRADNASRVLLDARLRLVLALLGRPWTPDGRVLVKPANQANGLVIPILNATRPARGLLLHSSLRMFLISCLKKLPESEQRIRWMAQALLPGTRLAHNLGISPQSSFNLIEACVLAWYAQIERFADALVVDSSEDRLRTLDFAEVLRSPVNTVAASSDWLNLPRIDVESRVRDVFARDSKSHRSYGPEQREAEEKAAAHRFGPLVDRALLWAETTVAPVAVIPSDWKPLIH